MNRSLTLGKLITTDIPMSTFLIASAPTHLKRLENTRPGEGYHFMGEGDVQNADRSNAWFTSKRLREVIGIEQAGEDDGR